MVLKAGLVKAVEVWILKTNELKNMKQLYIFFLLLLGSSCPAKNAVEQTPLSITENFFRFEGFAEKSKYLCCEAAEDFPPDSTFGQFIPKYISRNYEQLYVNNSTAVIAVELADSAKKNDFYVYFKKDSIWKIEAIRSLALSGIVEQTLAYLEKTPREELNAMNEKIYGKKNMPDIDFEIANSRLLLSSDKELIEHFKKNKKIFKDIAGYYTDKGFIQNSTPAKDDAHLQKLLKEIFISHIGADDMGQVDICLTIGGMVDNTVGYFYQPDTMNVPKMDKAGYIMIRDLGEGWYLFKTT